MDYQLYPHQLVARNFLAGRRRALLADEQGLGKTASAICAADMVGARKMLVLAPASVATNWLKELRQWSPGRRVQLLKTGRDKIVEDTVVSTHGLLLGDQVCAEIRRARFDVAIVDEAHAFTKPTAQRTSILFGNHHAPSLLYKVPHVWFLSGTPMRSDPSNMWTLVRECRPTDIWDHKTCAPMSYGQFMRRYCQLAFTPYGTRMKVVGAKREDELRDIVASFSLRRLKAQELNLPPKLWSTIALDATDAPPPPGDYESLEEARADAAFATYQQACGVVKAHLALPVLQQAMSEGNKIVVFARHIEALDVLERGLPNCIRIDGSTPVTTRGKRVDRFQNDDKVRAAVCNINAAGMGITLTASRSVYFVEQTWTPSDTSQAVDRCHRIGQTGTVSATLFELEGSVDASINEALWRKSQMIDAIIG